MREEKLIIKIISHIIIIKEKERETQDIDTIVYRTDEERYVFCPTSMKYFERYEERGRNFLGREDIYGE